MQTNGVAMICVLQTPSAGIMFPQASQSKESGWPCSSRGVWVVTEWDGVAVFVAFA